MLDITPLDEDTEPHEYEPDRCSFPCKTRNIVCMLKVHHWGLHESFITRDRVCKVVATWGLNGNSTTEIRDYLSGQKC